MSRPHDADARWEWQPTEELDEDGEPFGDYVLAGSYSLDPFEAMVFASAGATHLLDLNPYLGDLS